jgi:hypothetical protein
MLDVQEVRVDIKEITVLVETIAASVTQATHQTNECWAKVFEDQTKLRREELAQERQLRELEIVAQKADRDREAEFRKADDEARKAEEAASNERLDGIVKMLTPSLMMLAQSLLMRHGAPIAPSPPMPSVAPSSPTPPLQRVDGWRVSDELVREWSELLASAFSSKLRPDTQTLLRAYVASMSMPDAPAIAIAPLLEALKEDLGVDSVARLIVLTQKAWTQEGPIAPPPTSSPSSVN